MKFSRNFATMSEVQKEQLIPLMREFADIFSISKHDIGLTGMVAHEINTGDE